MNNKWRPTRWLGEDTGGLELQKEKIRDVAKTTYGNWPYIIWREPENTYGAKRNRIKGFETLLRTNRMFFVNAAWNNDVFDQLEKYTGQKSTKYSKDDVPDVMSMLSFFLPSSSVPRSKRELEEEKLRKEAEYREYLRRAHRKVIWGDDSGGFGLSNFTPYPGYEPPEEPRSNNLGKSIFGGNGMRA